MRVIFKTLTLSILFFSLSSQSHAMRRLIVKYKGGQVVSTGGAQVKVSASVGNTGLTTVQYYHFDRQATDSDVDEMIKEMHQNPFVEYVEEDLILKAVIEPSDPEYSRQWALYDSLGGANLPSAWNETTGDSNEVIAVVDTGVLAHPDLAGKVLQGFDFVSDAAFGNDGGGRDSDPTDPGDWIESGDICFQGQTIPSSWHGTHVSGIIAASTNNGQGMAGTNWNGKILPVRSLGKCGGYSSDIADGIRWAAGGSVSGVPANPNPAKVINLSLGGVGPCGQYMQDAINFAVSRGATVVVASGNSNTDMSSFTPANCGNVIRVGAVDRAGNKAHYSNFGTGIDIMAPGGGGNFGAGIISTHHTGSTDFSSGSYTYNQLSGTSMAAPYVAGIISLMYAVKSGEDLYPGQMLQIIKSHSKGFPSGTNCLSNPGLCGAGIIDATAAVIEAIHTNPDPTVSGNSPITSGRGPASLQITQDDGGGCGSVDLGGSNGGGKGGPISLALGFMLALLATQLGRQKKRL